MGSKIFSPGQKQLSYVGASRQITGDQSPSLPRPNGKILDPSPCEELIDEEIVHNLHSEPWALFPTKIRCVPLTRR